MITGVRLTQLELGEPLLGASWEYKTLTGKEAVEKRLDDIFYNASYLGFNLIIDTILQTNLLFDKQDYKLLSYNYEQYPYYCNHVHFIKNIKWKKAIEEFSHGFDEVS